MLIQATNLLVVVTQLGSLSYSMWTRLDFPSLSSTGPTPRSKIFLHRQRRESDDHQILELPVDGSLAASILHLPFDLASLRCALIGINMLSHQDEIAYVQTLNSVLDSQPLLLVLQNFLSSFSCSPCTMYTLNHRKSHSFTHVNKPACAHE